MSNIDEESDVESEESDGSEEVAQFVLTLQDELTRLVSTAACLGPHLIKLQSAQGVRWLGW